MKLVFACEDTQSVLKDSVTSATVGISVVPETVSTIVDQKVFCTETIGSGAIEVKEYRTFHEIVAVCKVISGDYVGKGTFTISGDSTKCFGGELPFILDECKSPTIKVTLYHKSDSRDVGVSAKVTNNKNSNIFMD